ncbi:hypothetical protein C5167_033468 [Papaver somniferum]|uniref:DUF632 domain-containing protein n=1 Tax=Papaver somniferum TaxID=3469 RepID=A0A4Y7KDT4_PAPSO|nr:hypothetical protein C5167_033468 [Papaver somniferum]
MHMELGNKSVHNHGGSGGGGGGEIANMKLVYRLDTGTLVEQGPKSHFSTLEQLLAWEKKLYQEVKALEGENIEHEKKLSTLQSLEYMGIGEAKLDKTKSICKEAAVNDFGNITAVSTISYVIVQVRDTELIQLVEYATAYPTLKLNKSHA